MVSESLNPTGVRPLALDVAGGLVASEKWAFGPQL